MLLNSNSRYLIVFLLYSLFGVSQQYYFKNYNSDNGLPFVQVYAMFQSQDGFLCTGGYGGISKFDGKQFSNITTSDGLSDNNVNCISEFDNGTLVVGSLKGISILERNLVLERDFLNVLKDVAINTIYKESDNELLIGTERGLYVLTPHAIRFIDGTRDLDVRAIVSRDSKIYFGGNFGLKVIDKGNVIAHEINDKLESKHINALCFDKSKSNLVIGTGNGLTILDVKNSNHYTFKISNGLIDNNINCLLSGSDSSIWIGTPSGLMKLKNNELKFFNIGMENNANIIRCLIEDFEGNIWIGTHSGIYRFRDEAFSSFDKLNGPGNAFIFEIFKANNALYLCSENRGVFKYSEGYFERFGHDKGIINNVCRSGAVDKNNNVYLESGNSVLQLKNGRLEKITISKQVKAPIYKIYCDSKNRLWIGGYNGLGLVNFDTKADTSFLPLPFYDENTSITDIFEDKYGRIWISAYKSGLYLYADGKIENILSRIKYEDNDIVSARADDKNVYVASLNGLLIVDINTFQTRLINSQFGLLSDIIYSIGFAKNKQKLWLGTNIGVSELDLQKYRKNGEISIISYTKDDGFIGVECNTNGIFEDTDGTVYFGTVSGLIKYLPNQFKSNKIEAKQIIYNMKLGDVDTILPDKVKLEYASNTISFYFRGICLTNPDNVFYQYRLIGYDKEFCKPTKENYIKYNNLSSGTYTFELMSSNNEGKWNATPLTYVFSIKTPYYRTWWFYLLLISAVIISVYSGFKFRLNYLKREQKREFDRKVEISKLELKALRSQMNPHFVFNSLNSIQHYIFSSKPEEAVKYLNKFAKLIRVILNSSDKPTVAIEDDIEALKLYLELEKMRFEDKFDYEITVSKDVDTDYDIMPPMLLQPYVENAILHGLTPLKEKGKLIIEIKREGNFIVCVITDNGIGRKKSSEVKRMMPGKKHKSFGLKITEDRLRILNELSGSEHNVVITDLEDKLGNSLGTKVEIFVPIL